MEADGVWLTPCLLPGTVGRGHVPAMPDMCLSHKHAFLVPSSRLEDTRLQPASLTAKPALFSIRTVG